MLVAMGQGQGEGRGMYRDRGAYCRLLGWREDDLTPDQEGIEGSSSYWSGLSGEGRRVCCQEELRRGWGRSRGETGIEAGQRTWVGWAGVGQKLGSGVRVAQKMRLWLQPGQFFCRVCPHTPTPACVPSATSRPGQPEVCKARAGGQAPSCLRKTHPEPGLLPPGF